MLSHYSGVIKRSLLHSF